MSCDIGQVLALPVYCSG